MDPINQGKPSPRKTLTQLDPVILPIATSALSDCMVACLLANVSGKEVPKATILIAVRDCLSVITHPSKAANSPTIAVRHPMKISEIRNEGHPCQCFAGGTVAKRTFHPMHKKCKAASQPVISSMMPFSSIWGDKSIAFLN
mmetsp:Transcript_11533/g.11485  ORF Transcript_11533/g.11485 Transcript_11533/m.11485 type:complete len:141 (-) Transcript_11533:597-1019(-)